MKILMALLSLIPVVAQGAVVMDASELRNDADLLTARVVDARGAADASQLPVAGALPYSRGVRVFDQRVVVIGDDLQGALAAARELEKASPGLAAVVLKGGYEALREARPQSKLRDSNVALVPTFTIPSDTCQMGKALHTFKGMK
jgi:hypothetical protein